MAQAENEQIKEISEWELAANIQKKKNGGIVTFATTLTKYVNVLCRGGVWEGGACRNGLNRGQQRQERQDCHQRSDCAQRTRRRVSEGILLLLLLFL